MIGILGRRDLAIPALRYAGVLDPDGSLTPDARDRLIRLETIVALRQAAGDRWTVVMTVPAYLRTALPRGRIGETYPTLHDLVSGARRRLTIASPFLDPGFENLIPAIAAFVTRGGEVVLLTRELARPDSHNTAIVRSLRQECGQSPRLDVVSWEEEGLGLHLKALVADSARAYVGSANFTWGGFGGHAELGVRLDGPSVHEIERLLDLLAGELRRRRRLQSR